MCSSCPSEAVAAKSITQHHILRCWSLLVLDQVDLLRKLLLVQTSSFLAHLSASLVAVPNSFSGSGFGSGSGSAVEQGMELPLGLHKMYRTRSLTFSFSLQFSAQLGLSQAQYT